MHVPQRHRSSPSTPDCARPGQPRVHASAGPGARAPSVSPIVEELLVDRVDARAGPSTPWRAYAIAAAGQRDRGTLLGIPRERWDWTRRTHRCHVVQMLDPFVWFDPGRDERHDRRDLRVLRLSWATNAPIFIGQSDATT